MIATVERARVLRKRMTPQEIRLWVRLRSLRAIGWHFRRQAPVGPHIVDFACLRQRLVVEVDGGQHAMQPHQRNDLVRSEFLKASGFRVLRFWNSDIDRNLEGAVETILSELSCLSELSGPHPDRLAPVASPPAGRGRKRLS
jgi:very-short-patch-repair endonuclease